MVNKRQLPQISKEKVKKMWKEKLGKKEEVFPDVPFKEILSYAIIINIAVVVIVLLLRSFLPPEIPLYYGLPENSDQLVSNWFLPIPSILSLVIIVINLFLAKFLKDEFLKKVLVFSSIAITLFSLITTVKITLLIGNF